MRIEKWILRNKPMSVCRSTTVFEGQIVGKIYNSEKFVDGTLIITSDIVELDPEYKFAKTLNSFYELGESLEVNKWI